MTGDLSDKVWYNVIIHSFSVFTDRKRHLLEVCLCEQLYSAYPAQVLMLINKTIGSIERGFLVLLGVADDDTEEDMAYLVKKITQMRIFEDEAGKMIFFKGCRR